jgi:hypothetical protein
MSRKEWLEVGRQCLYFVLLIAGIALLIGAIDLVHGWSFESEKLIIMLGLWLLTASMFLGLSPFALDAKQKGMEYLLTLPIPRRRLLFMKFLPRLAAIVLFYILYLAAYRLMGSDAFGGGFVFFSLACFALFLISFSLSVAHENFIVQFILAVTAWCGYLALCLLVVMLGFTWKFKVPAAWVGSGIWHDLSYDVPTLLVSVAVFLVMSAPFVLSIFLAFKGFDLKPARAFNRRQLLIFAPLLLLAFAASLAGTYLAQKGSPACGPDVFLLGQGRLLKADFPGKLYLYDAGGRRTVDTHAAVFWERLLVEQGERSYLSGYDEEDGSRFVGCLNRADLSWNVLYRCPDRHFVVPGYQGFIYDGEGFVYLRRIRVEAERPGMDSRLPVKRDALELVSLDMVGEKNRTITFESPLFRKYYEPQFIGNGRLNGLRFWLLAFRRSHVLRLWEDGRVEDFGFSKGLPAYAGGLLFMLGDHSLVVRRLLDAGSGIVKEIEGRFTLVSPFHYFPFTSQMGEIYAERDKRIVRIDLATLAVDDVGPCRGRIWTVPPGDFYYVEFETWPGLLTDKWKKLYRLQDGKMVFLKQFDFNDAGYGHVFVDTCGIILHQSQLKNNRVIKTSTRAFAFPDLKELKFDNLN